MQLPDPPSTGRRGTRLLIVGLAVGLAALPAACGTLSGGGGKGASNDPSATTVFRTITVELATSTSAAPDAGAAGGGAAGSAVTLSPDVYEVQAGDYWYGIAKKLGVDVNALWAANNANSKTLLLPGKRLAVPKPGDAAGLQPPAAGGGAPAGGSAAPPAPTLAPGSAPGSYQIVAGDYWLGIAKKLNVSLNALLQANNATTKTVLIPGKYLKVPKS
jgi:LysM repeat protein